MTAGRAYYFGYGIFLSPSRMQSVAGSLVETVGLGTLDGWRRTTRGYADIVQAPGSTVTGAVYRIHPHHLKVLDRVEGYPGWYTRKQVTVDLKDGGQVRAWAYTMTPAEKAVRREEPDGRYSPEPSPWEMREWE